MLVAESQGFLPPDKAQALAEQVARTQDDLERLRRDNPDWASEVDAAIEAFNASDLTGARDAFACIDALIEERRVELLAEEAALRMEAARSKHAQATLFYPGPSSASKAEPLLTAAAELAQTNIGYWLDCGRARCWLQKYESALLAYSVAEGIARGARATWELGEALRGIGFAKEKLDDLGGAIFAYKEGASIARAFIPSQLTDDVATFRFHKSLWNLGELLHELVITRKL